MTPAKILVVDDEPGIRLIMEDTLTLDGHQVTAVENGEAALALVANQAFDLALLDLVLPGMNGMEVLAALRQQSPDTVVILLTAHASLDTAVKALREGAHDYLFKPCKTIELRQSVRQGLLKRQRILEQRHLLSKLEQHLTELSRLRTLLTEDTESGLAPATPAPDLDQLMTPITAPSSEQGRFLQYGSLIVDFSQHVIILQGHLLELSPTEFNVMAYLASEAPRVVSPQELLREVQGYDSGLWEAREMVRQYIFSIRQKIKEATGLTDTIRTARGIGYTVNS